MSASAILTVISAFSGLVLLVSGIVVTIFNKWVDQHKALVVIGFVVLGSIPVVTTIAQSVKADGEADTATKKHDAEQAALQHKLDTSTIAQAEMRGQLNTVGAVLGRIAGNTGRDPGLKAVADALGQLAASNAKPNISASTDDTLKTKVLALIKLLRDWSAKSPLSSDRFSEDSIQVYMRDVQPSVLEVIGELRRRGGYGDEGQALINNYDILVNKHMNRVPYMLDALRKVSSELR